MERLGRTAKKYLILVDSYHNQSGCQIEVHPYKRYKEDEVNHLGEAAVAWVVLHWMEQMTVSLG